MTIISQMQCEEYCKIVVNALEDKFPNYKIKRSGWAFQIALNDNKSVITGITGGIHIDQWSHASTRPFIGSGLFYRAWKNGICVIGYQGHVPDCSECEFIHLACDPIPILTEILKKLELP